KEAVFPAVITRLAASFRATDYDMKELFRTVLNSETYQRQIRLGETTEEHLHFAAVYPTRLRADALWASLTGVLGTMAPAAPPPTRTQPAGRRGCRGGACPPWASAQAEGSEDKAWALRRRPGGGAKRAARGAAVKAGSPPTPREPLLNDEDRRCTCNPWCSC